MRYMMLYKPGKDLDGTPPSEQEMAALGQLIEEMMKAGVLVQVGGLQQSSTGVRVRKSGEKLTVTDGPFAETKELIAGFAIVDVKSTAEAIELARRFLDVVGEGESEIRPMQEAADLAAV